VQNIEMVQKGAWPMRFEHGEARRRLEAGEWTGRTIVDYVLERVRDHPDTVAFVDDAGSRTFGEIYEEACAVARGLLELGLEPGETISFQLPNWLETAAVSLACARAGFVLNPIIPIYRQSELRFILNDCRSRAVFVPRSFRNVDFVEMIEEVRPEALSLEHVFVVRGAPGEQTSYEKLIEIGRASLRTFDPVDPDSAKFIIYTSGTTAQPKGVIYSHNQARRPLWAAAKAWQLEEGTKVFMPSPVTHVTGYLLGLDMVFLFGTQTYLMEKWDAAQAVELIDRFGLEFTLGATPFLAEMAHEAAKVGSGLPSLRIFPCGGAAVPPELIRRTARIFSNCRAFRVYGSSECPLVTLGCPDDAELSATTDGRVYDWDVKIVDAEGATLPPGSEGEILAKGPALFRGYTSLEANRDSFDGDGYFRTGDLGMLNDDDVITITGRKKDIIIRGGENLSAKEIEDALHEHPAVRAASVVAMPHERLGEGVCAYLIPVDAERPTVGEMKSFLVAKGLARQKCPEHIEYVEQFPTTASGKIQKHILRKMIFEKISSRP
jgi:acyl-CoA synthetase (AMP-forming)/AMP-acid ligase II